MRSARWLPVVLVLTFTMFVTSETTAEKERLWVGPNVNMVSGTTWPDGDPFLQRQNEPSIAVSTRNSLHLLAGANDYRTVDLPGLPAHKETGDAWLGVFRSVDGGGSWKSTLVRGYPQDQIGGSPLHGYDAAADPVVRAGTHGLFYYSGIVFNRSLQQSAAFVQRFMDLNNETVEPVRYIDTVVVDSFNAGEAFIDKPWLEVDIPRANAQTVTLYVPQGNTTVSQTVPCGNVYMAWAEITGQGATLRTRIMFSRSTDCGGTWSNPFPISLSNTVGQGATIAVEPATGRVYVAWRQFHSATVNCVREKGYWKDNSKAWPVASLVVGGVTYTKQQALAILQKSYPPSDAPGILAQQLIPAKLNVFSGANGDAIKQVIIDADAWLVKFPLGSKPSSAQKQAGLALKDKLEAFNKGLTGSPTCAAATTSYPDAVLLASSGDGGQSFSAPLQVAAVSPFDQGTSEYSFRTNAYPTMAVDETGRAYLAWATRGLATSTANPDPVAGDARIVVTTSKNGTTWTTPKPIDQPKLPGHQLFPSLTYNTGKLLLVYNDYRADASGVFERFIVDLMDATHPMRHTVDVRAAVANPADAPVFTDYSLLNPSSQVSRYPFIVTGTSASDAKSLQLQYNPPNLPMFELGHKPFFGDYHDVAGAPRFVPTGNGTWSYNSAPSTAPVFHAVWTDNRDVVGPPDGDWSNYVPPGTDSHISLFDGSTLVPNCQATSGGADRTQMRNQNIYTSRLVSGLYVTVPSNARPLSLDFQRAFVIFVQNATDAARQFRLQILNQPGGGTASFQQFSGVVTQDVTIGAYSSISQAVFVTSSNPEGSVDVRVGELGACSSTNTCLQSTVRINPDSSNPPPADASLLAGETYNPAVLNPAVYNPAVYNPAVFNPAVFNPAVFNPAVFNPAVFNDSVINYDVNNPAVFNPAVLNPAVFNPAVFNIDAFNNAVMNQALLNPAVFNPAVLNPAVLNPAVFNPAVFNPAVLNPAVLNAAVFNPAVFNPAVLNPAVFNPAVFNTALSDGSVTEANFKVENAGNTTAAYSLNLSLANAPTGFSYQLMIYRLYFTPVTNGCELTEAAQQELLVNSLSPNLSAGLLDPNGGASFFLNPGDVAIATLRITPDPNAASPGDPSQINLGDLSVSVISKGVNSDAAALGDTQPPVAQILAPSLLPLVIDSTPLPSGVVGSAYATTLAATGGAGPRVWSAFGALPPGLTLTTVSPNGLLSGTPTTAGSFTFTIRVTDATQFAERSLTLTITGGATLSVGSTAPPNVVGGQPFSILFHVEDPSAAPLPGAVVTLSLGTVPCSGASLSGFLVGITDATGNVTFSNLAIDRGGVGYTIIGSVSMAGYAPASLATSPINVEGFCATGSTGTYRWRSSVTKLADGRVLVAGGLSNTGTPLGTAEIYDPATGLFTPTAGTLSVGRLFHQGVLLPSGMVLIVGGYDTWPAGHLATVAELFDPGTGAFSPTASSPSTGRVFFTSTWVPAAGKVLIAGGGKGVVTASAEVYDPATDSFSPTGSMNAARSTHTATLLNGGQVLLVGGGSNTGASLVSAELWDPATGIFTLTGSLGTARQQNGAVKLPDGGVLLLGGVSYPGGTVLSSAEIYNPVAGTFSPTGSMTNSRFDLAAAPLASGKVLVVGGQSGGWLHSAEVFDPATGGFTPTGSSLLTPYDGQAILLATDRALVVSYDNSHPSELFYPTPPTVFLVTTIADAGAGSLRQAILDANAHPGLDAIHFDIPGAGLQTISPVSALPITTDPVLLDATTQPGYAGTPLIRLDGASLSDAVNGLEILAGNSMVEGFMVTSFTNVGIQLTNASGTRVAHNYAGTDGTTAFGNGQPGFPWPTGGGIFVSGGSGNVLDGNLVSGNIGNGIELWLGATGTTVRDNLVGMDPAGTGGLANGGWGIFVAGPVAAGNTVRNNLVSGNTRSGIYLNNDTHHNTVAGNLIGSNALGTAKIPNESGVQLTDGAHDNTIGGTGPGDGNVILGNTNQGIYLTHDTTTGNVILGNWIGTNPAMAAGLGNTFEGILIEGAPTSATGTQIGGSAPGEANVIAYNGDTGVKDEGVGTQIVGNLISANGGHGVTLYFASGATVSDNRIGTDAAGAAALGNALFGVYVDNSSSNTVRGNLISGNAQAGVWLVAAASNIVAANRIGTNAAGTLSVANGWSGIGMWDAAGNTIGGSAPADANLISGNASQGIGLYHGCTSNTISRNLIGTNETGTMALPNAGAGVLLEDATTINNAISGNLISGNASNGITLQTNATGTSVMGNSIGTDTAGAVAIGNIGDGIGIYSAASGSTVSDNVVAASTNNGVRVFNAAGNTIRHNWIGTNAALAAGLGNGDQGISVEASSGTTIGGTNPGDGNVVTFNGEGGISLENGVTKTQILGNLVSGNTGPGIGVLNSQTTTIAGNKIGTDAAGVAAWPNTGSGISLSGSVTAGNTIGGTTGADRNVISGNAMYGVWIYAAAHDNTIEGNQVGTDAAGNVGLPNLVGIAVNASNNIVRANLVSGNTADGIDCGNSAAGNLIEDNRIGTNAGGTAPLGKQHFGVQFFGAATTANTIRGNLICGNDFGLVFLDGAHHNTAAGNKIGTDLSGVSAIPNGDGVLISLNAHDNVIGGTAPGAGNVISGNAGNGVAINGGATLTTVVGNLIGTDAGGTVAVPNSLSGISIAGSNTQIGSHPPPDTSGNVIAFNGAYGIEVVSGTRNDIVSNRIYSNSSLGIYLGAGANDGLNAPVITSAVDDGVHTWISGTVTVGDPTVTEVWVDFFVNAACDSSGYGEGETLLGHTLLFGSGGVFSFTTLGFPPGHGGQVVTATAQAIDGAWSGDTSQFSACVSVGP